MDDNNLTEEQAFNRWHLGACKEADEEKPWRTGINVLTLHDQLEGKGHEEVKVAILDTGCDIEHPALNDAIDQDLVRDFDFTDRAIDKKNGVSLSEDGRVHNPHEAHGTASAGIVAANPDGDDNHKGDDEGISLGITGVAPKCKIVPIRISNNFETDALVNAINYAADHGDLVLLPRYLPDRPEVRKALREAATTIPVVCAAGNSGRSSLAFPASLDETIAVGACNQHGYRSTYSQYGEGLHVVAPSNDIDVEVAGFVRLT
ncbi:MAG: S8 family serine peptidase, partial [Geminicoccaceae bacterium]